MSEPDNDFTKIRSFLAAAAFDDNFRQRLQTSSPKEAQDLLQERFSLRVSVPETRMIPPKAVCKELLSWVSWLEEYSDVAVRDSAFGAVTFVVSHAMPLVVSTEDAVAAR